MKYQRLVFIIVFLFGFTSCSTMTTQERIEERRATANPRAAAYAADGFILGNRMPEPRENQHWEFFYKHCNLEGRTPYPKRSDWNCTDPY